MAAVDRISQIGHLSGRNAVKQEFYDESSKISLLTISNVRLAEWNDLEASDGILQIGLILACDGDR